MSDESIPVVPVDAAELLKNLIHDLSVPDDVAALQSSVHFEGGLPFLPIPHKSQAASAAMLGLLGITSARLLQIRRAQKQDGQNAPNISINTDHASLFLSSFAFGRFGEHGMITPEFQNRIPPVNEEPRSAIRQEATNVYKTKDGQFFHLHGSLSPSATLRLINVNPDHPTEKDAEARDIIQAACLHYTADELRQLYTDAGLVGDIVLKPEEFDASEQGKILGALPLARFIPIANSEPSGPISHLPPLQNISSKPLEGVRIVEMTRIIAGGVAGRLLAEMGASIVRVIDESLPDFKVFQPDYGLDKRPVYINLRSSDGKKQMAHLLETADIFLQGYRPGVMNRLGLSHSDLAKIGTRRGKPFVIIDESCYGGEFESAPSSTRPGYQQIADSITGVAWETGWACGKDEPIVPCLPISDYLTGIMCATMATLGLVKKEQEGGGAGTVVCPVALSSIDMWLRKQDKYPSKWVRQTYESGPPFDYTWFFVKMLMGTIQQQQKTHPEYFQPSFFETLPSTPSCYAGPGAKIGDIGPSYTHLAPVIKFEGVPTGFSSTASWGYYRPGWDEADADELENTLRSKR